MNLARILKPLSQPFWSARHGTSGGAGMDGPALQRGQKRGPAGEEAQRHVRRREMLDILQARRL